MSIGSFQQNFSTSEHISRSCRFDNNSFRKLNFRQPVTELTLRGLLASSYPELASALSQTSMEKRPNAAAKGAKHKVILSAKNSNNSGNGGLCNTPLQSQQNRVIPRLTVHFDYLAGVIDGLSRSDLRFLVHDVIRSYWPSPLKKESYLKTLGDHKFTHRYISPEGFMLLEYLDVETHCYVLYLNIPGTPFRSLSVPQSITFLSQLVYGFGFRVSRVDPAMDDYSRTVSIRQLYAAIVGRKAFSGFRRHSETSSNYGDEYYRTLYLGKGGKRSRPKKFVRIYDAKPVHGLDCIRFEAQLKEGYAKAFVDQILGSCNVTYKGFYTGFYYQSLHDGSEASMEFFEPEICKSIVSMIIGHLDFYVQKVSKNLDRNQRVSWWDEMLALIDYAQYRWKLPQREFSINKSVKWLYKTVSKTLAILQIGLSADFCQAFIREMNKKGMKRIISRNDKYLIKTLKNATKEELHKLIYPDDFLLA